MAGVSRRLGPPVLLSVASALLVGQVAELFFAGVGIPTYSDRFYPASAPERQLQRLVGGSLVGLDTGLPDVIQRSSPVGFYPEVNIGYGIRLFAAHDPLLPAAYFTTWPGPAPAPSGGPSLFFPDIDSVALARRYGIGFILASPRVTVAPAGALPVAVLDGEHLYKVPGAARFSLQGPGTVAPTGGNGNGSFTITADPARREQIVLRVTDFPGWHLTSDGRPVALSSVEGVMESAVLPPGKQQLHLWYWPDRLTTGLVAAGVAAGLLVLWLLGWGETLARLARLGISVPDGSARTASGGGGRARR